MWPRVGCSPQNLYLDFNIYASLYIVLALAQTEVNRNFAFLLLVYSAFGENFPSHVLQKDSVGFRHVLDTIENSG